MAVLPQQVTDDDHLDVVHVHWYVVCGIVVGCLAFLVGVSVCAYRWQQRRAQRDVNSRLSTAIRKGFKESSSGTLKRSSSQKSTTSVKSTGSSGKSVISGGGGGALPQQGSPQEYQGQYPGNQIARSPSRQSLPDPGKAECCIENEECQGLLSKKSPSEKEDVLREKAEDELKLVRLGNLQFAVEYDHHKTALVVTIIRASELPAKDPNIGSSDPYVKLQLLPDKRHKVKTRVLRKTLNPVYDEIFTFYGIDHNQLQGITLHFVVLSFDRFSRDDIIGEVIYPLTGLELAEKEPITLMKPISPRHIKIHSQGRGELLVSLCYQPAANRLTVVVLKARNLPKMDITGLSDPYVKIYLLYNGQRIAKKKTHVKKRTLNPVFNESFLFDVPSNEGLANICLEFMILDWDRMTKNEVVGRLEIGAKQGGQETHHWNEVMNCPRKQIAEWHKLKE